MGDLLFCSIKLQLEVGSFHLVCLNLQNYRFVADLKSFCILLNIVCLKVMLRLKSESRLWASQEVQGKPCECIIEMPSLMCKPWKLLELVSRAKSQACVVSTCTFSVQFSSSNRQQLLKPSSFGHPAHGVLTC